MSQTSDASQAFQIRTSDGDVFDVSLQVAQQMGLTQSWLQYGLKATDSSDDITEANIMPLDRVSSEVFQLVLKWCQELQTINDNTVEENEDLQREMFQRILVGSNATDSTIYELIIAADYLNIESLLQAGTRYVADVIKSCDSVDEIRHRLHIIYDSEVEDDIL